ncbi:MAG: ftsK [Oscillospiraceae bacterium]|nr:ftsK [Oscillospiraceae bacterium]
MANTKKSTTSSSKKSTNKGKSATSPSYNAKKAEEKEKSSRQLWAVILFVVGIFLFALCFIKGQNIWSFLRDILYGTFGATAVSLPIIILYMAIMYTLDKPIGSIKHKLWQSGVLVALLCGAIQIFTVGEVIGEHFIAKILNLFEAGKHYQGGGLAGAVIGWPLMSASGRTGAKIIIVLLIFLFVMLLTGGTLIGLFKAVQRPCKKIGENYSRYVQEREAKFNIDVDLGPESEMPQHPVSSPKYSIDIPLDDKESKKKQKSNTREELPQEDNKTPQQKPSNPVIEELIKNAVKQPEQDIITDLNNQTKLYSDSAKTMNFVPPPISLLKLPKASSNVDVSEELKYNADRLVDTLKSFGVQTRIVHVSRGPTVTRYELQPSAGVKISRITGLADDIALNLAAAGVRIEAPIPNKPAVGIEVPNKVVDIVTIREIVDSGEFDNAKSKLTVALGKDIAGNVTVADLAKMPHVLIAGATGSGKSVCINSIITSLLYKSSSDEVKLLMIDPKVVELGIYNGIPHLLVPVVTDPRKAAGALNWAVTEMLNRYKLFADNGVRDLTGYNKLAESSETLNPMPQIVIIIDELADLMMAAPNEVEDAICRLAKSCCFRGVFSGRFQNHSRRRRSGKASWQGRYAVLSCGTAQTNSCSRLLCFRQRSRTSCRLY